MSGKDILSIDVEMYIENHNILFPEGYSRLMVHDHYCKTLIVAPDTSLFPKKKNLQ